MRLSPFLVAPLTVLACAAPASAAGDLLVAPTRVVLDGPRGTEVFLNNIGNEPATYRVSLELRRMCPDGRLEEVTAPTPAEQQALAMISYAPRRVTLPPNQPQAIRIGVRAAGAVPDGEYRVHMLFRAVPDPKPVTAQAAPAKGISIALTPIYGVTIPVIVRKGSLSATAALSNARIVREGGREAIAFDLSRQGDRSTYGEVRVLKPGEKEPVVLARGIAAYPEIARRTVTLQPRPDFAGTLAGPVTIQYVEPAEDGGRTIAEAQVVLR